MLWACIYTSQGLHSPTPWRPSAPRIHILLYLQLWHHRNLVFSTRHFSVNQRNQASKIARGHEKREHLRNAISRRSCLSIKQPLRLLTINPTKSQSQLLSGQLPSSTTTIPRVVTRKRHNQTLRRNKPPLSCTACAVPPNKKLRSHLHGPPPPPHSDLTTLVLRFRTSMTSST